MPRRKKQTMESSLASSLSSCKEEDMTEISNKIFEEINRKELEKSLDRWLKNNSDKTSIAIRDLSLLKSIITEYLDAFLVFGYNTEGERIILKHYTNSKDRDAIMEFLKTLFINQQQDNFLD
jgi:hypothetical protein